MDLTLNIRTAGEFAARLSHEIHESHVISQSERAFDVS